MALTRGLKGVAIGISVLAIAVVLGVPLPAAGLSALKLAARLTGGEVDSNSVWINLSVTWIHGALAVGAAVAVMVGRRAAKRARAHGAR